MIISDPVYQPRSARFLELWEWQGWRVKVNGLAAHADYPSVELVQAAKRIAQQRLPLPAIAGDRYGAAYLVVHEGRDADFVLVDWWTAGGDRTTSCLWSLERARWSTTAQLAARSRLLCLGTGCLLV